MSFEKVLRKHLPSKLLATIDQGGDFGQKGSKKARDTWTPKLVNERGCANRTLYSQYRISIYESITYPQA